MNHDETHHADLTPEQREGISQALDEIRTSAALLRKYEAEAKRAQERAEECRRRGTHAAAQLFTLLEQLPGSTYHAPNGTTYHAVRKGHRHPDGTMTVEKTVTATTGRITNALEVSTERGALLTKDGSFYEDHVRGNYTDPPEPAKGETATIGHVDHRPTRTNDLRKHYQQERQDGEAPANYSAQPRQGVLMGGILEAGPALRPQPKWPQGEEPDFITNITGGFVDGTGRAHPAPRRFDLNGPLSHFNAARKIAGQWRWYALDPDR